MEENTETEVKQEQPAIEQKEAPKVTQVIIQAQKNPGMAAVLSALCTGMGQLYNGQIGKGLLFMFVQVINVLLMFVVIGFITLPIFWVYGIWDAHNVAKLMNSQGQTQIIQS